MSVKKLLYVMVIEFFLGIMSGLVVARDSECRTVYRSGDDANIGISTTGDNKKRIQVIIKKLTSSDPVNVLLACKEIAELGVGAKAALPGLMRNLRSQHPKVRFAVLQAIGKMKSDAAIKPVIELLQEEEHRYVANEAIVFFYELADAKGVAKAVPTLVNVMHKQYRKPTKITTQDAKFYGRESTAEIVDVPFGRRVAATIVEFGAPAISELQRILEDKKASVRDRCACVLCLERMIHKVANGGMGTMDDDCVGLLIVRIISRALDDPSDFVRLRSIQSLGKVGKIATNILDKLMAIQNDTNVSTVIREAASNTILRIRELQKERM